MMVAATKLRRDRLRRVVILCRNFAVNLAYYRVGRKTDHLHLQDYQKRGNFWRAASGKFIDICVLEWCKLFADPKGKHHWSKVVSEPANFGTQLLNHLGIDEAALQKEIEVMRQLSHVSGSETRWF